MYGSNHYASTDDTTYLTANHLFTDTAAAMEKMFAAMQRATRHALRLCVDFRPRPKPYVFAYVPPPLTMLEPVQCERRAPVGVRRVFCANRRRRATRCIGLTRE